MKQLLISKGKLVSPVSKSEFAKPLTIKSQLFLCRYKENQRLICLNQEEFEQQKDLLIDTFFPIKCSHKIQQFINQTQE
jgi:hypothetical protein